MQKILEYKKAPTQQLSSLPNKDLCVRHQGLEPWTP